MPSGERIPSEKQGESKDQQRPVTEADRLVYARDIKEDDGRGAGNPGLGENISGDGQRLDRTYVGPQADEAPQFMEREDGGNGVKKKLTGKQRAVLRAESHKLPVDIQVGKAGRGEQALIQLEKVLDAREIAKIKVMKNSPVEVDEAVAWLVKELKAQVVSRVGRVLVIYRESEEGPLIPLP